MAEIDVNLIDSRGDSVRATASVDGDGNYTIRNKRRSGMVDPLRIIDLLERAKNEHRDGGIEGLTSCPANSYERIGTSPEGFAQWGYIDRPDLCDCGASAINAEIDAMIAELRNG